MKHEWKPGDVAIVDGPGTRLPITFFRNEECGELMFNNGCGYRHPVRRLASAARPLAVIDPENHEEIERLVASLEALSFSVWGCGAVSAMQAALREFANPKPPKPDEPTGLGAVVEDAAGNRWTRIYDGISTGEAWYCDLPLPTELIDDRQWKHYADIDAVRVLSEGVPVE